jgi:hypothetical protein
VKMFVRAFRVEWQPDPESPRRIRGYGPIGVRSEDVDYRGVQNRSNRSHQISRVVHNHFCRHQETGNKKTAYLASGGRLIFPTGELFRYPHSRVTSFETLVSKKAPWRLHRQVAVSGIPEHLLMLTYTSPFSGESQQYYAAYASCQSGTTSMWFLRGFTTSRSIVMMCAQS